MTLSGSRLLRGKTAAVTGGTTGIGHQITLEYLRQGANVAVNHLGLPRDEHHRLSLHEEAEAMRKAAPKDLPAGELIDVAGDITDPEVTRALCEAAAEKWGSLDIFVANAAVYQPAEFLTCPKDVFNFGVKVNVNGAFYSCQAAANQMVKQGRGGSIIGISSISALLGGGMQAHYGPTKAAVLSMIQSMAVALALHKISQEKRDYLEKRILLGVGKPQDLAGPAVFLGCSELSGYMTGAQMLVDGDMFVHLQ
ncbi:short-chain dehydrogenase [Colletotrichum sojae]|uniref:Short-chain dehydrogenase n=1 Tax=Colletotrichum sojae TaxID=2175907 RepID=A0A8H6JEW1_9PEZI|nr:short-chain dehydrogenase [Colletotrichum sojae]